MKEIKILYCMQSGHGFCVPHYIITCNNKVVGSGITLQEAIENFDNNHI